MSKASKSPFDTVDHYCVVSGVSVGGATEKDILEALQLRDSAPTDLLRLFGRRAVSSPAFELVPAA